MESDRIFLSSAEKGLAIITLGDGWKYPVLTTITPFTIDKRVTSRDWEDAVQRTLAIARPDNNPVIITTTPKIPVGPLNVTERHLLEYIAKHEPALISEAINDLKLHPQAATRALKKLSTLEYVTTERITARRGRGGTANAIMSTNSGAAYAGIRRPLQSRGQTSAQHRFLATRISKKIPGSALEVNLNGKSVDILINYDSTIHASFRTIIDQLAGMPVRWKPGHLIAIEVEVSSPSKTATNNLLKNHAVGVHCTIIATTKPIPPDHDVITIDAFELLESL